MKNSKKSRQTLKPLVTFIFSTLMFDKIFSTSTGKLEGERIFHYVPGFCRALACMCTISCVNSLGSIVLMSSSFMYPSATTSCAKESSKEAPAL